MEEHANEIAEVLKVLANKYRLLIFCALSDRPLNVGEIGKKVTGITQSALSQHLSILKAHGILNSVKSGQTITYSVADEKVKDIIAVLEKLYCN